MGNSSFADSSGAICPFRNIPKLPDMPNEAQVLEQFRELLKIKGVTTVICDELSSIETLETQWAYICMDKAQDAAKFLITPKEAISQLQYIIGQNWQLYRHHPTLLAQLFRLIRISIIMNFGEWMEEFFKMDGMEVIIALLPQPLPNTLLTPIPFTKLESKLSMSETIRTQVLLTHTKSKKSSALLAVMYQEMLCVLFALSNLDEGIFAMSHAHETLFQRMLFLFSCTNPLGQQNEEHITNSFRARILKLLGIIACHSQSPQTAVMGAFNTYASSRSEPRFDTICAYFVESEEHPVFQCALLSFMNTLINTTLDPKARMSIREDLRHHGMMAMLESYIHEEYSTKHSSEMHYQLQMYFKYVLNDSMRPHHRTKCVTQLSELLQELASLTTHSSIERDKAREEELCSLHNRTYEALTEEKYRQEDFTILTVASSADSPEEGGTGSFTDQSNENTGLPVKNLVGQQCDSDNESKRTSNSISQELRQSGQEISTPIEVVKNNVNLHSAALSPSKASRVASSPFIKNLRRGIEMTSTSLSRIEGKSSRAVQSFTPDTDIQAPKIGKMHVVDGKVSSADNDIISKGEANCSPANAAVSPMEEETILSTEAKSQVKSKLSDSNTSEVSKNLVGVLQSSADSSKVSKRLRIRDMPSYGKFFKLLSMGAPAFAVKAKMAMAGLKSEYLDTPDAEIIEEAVAVVSVDLCEAEPVQCLPPPPPTSLRTKFAHSSVVTKSQVTNGTQVEEQQDNNITGILVKDHAQYVKFFKMLAMGIPAEIVKSKMMMAGVIPDMLDTPDAKYSSALSTLGTQHNNLVLSLPQPPPMTRSNTRPLYWQQYRESDQIRGTVWEELDRVTLDQSNCGEGSLEIFFLHLSDKDLSELATKFPAVNVSRQSITFNTNSSIDTNSPSGGSNNNSGAPLSPRIVFLIDRSRSNNISIIMKQFKISNEALREAIMKLDWSVLTLERVQGLLKILPSDEEIVTINNFKGDINTLNSAERVLKELIKIPRLERRLLAIQAKLQFPNLKSEIKTKIAKLKASCLEMNDCLSFKHVLYIILQVGNRMNYGTNRGNAKGFSLIDLTKLEQIRSHDKKSTLLHLIANLVRKKCGKAVNFYSQLQYLPHMRGCSLQDIPQELEKVYQLLELIENEAKAHDEFEADSDAFKCVMEGFVAEVALDVALLKEQWTDTLSVTRGTLLRYDKQPVFDSSTDQARSPQNDIKFNQGELLSNASAFFNTISDFGIALMRVDKENEDRRVRDEKQLIRSRSTSSIHKNIKALANNAPGVTTKMSSPEVEEVGRCDDYRGIASDQSFESLSNQSTKIDCVIMKDQIEPQKLDSQKVDFSSAASKNLLSSLNAINHCSNQTPKTMKDVKICLRKSHGKSVSRMVQLGKFNKTYGSAPLKKAFGGVLNRNRDKKSLNLRKVQYEPINMSQTLLISESDLLDEVNGYEKQNRKQEKRGGPLTASRKLTRAYDRRSSSCL